MIVDSIIVYNCATFLVIVILVLQPPHNFPLNYLADIQSLLDS